MTSLLRTAYRRVVFDVARALAKGICEPKLRLGRWRHDNHCDLCEDRIDLYGAEKLAFPLSSLDPDATTSGEKLRAMLNAEYVRVCLECATKLEEEA